MSVDKLRVSGDALSGLVASAVEYTVDAGQRNILFLDILRQRGDQYREHLAETAPHVLNFAVELVMDGYSRRRAVLMPILWSMSFTNVRKCTNLQMSSLHDSRHRSRT
jgi:hypothetical protein